MSSSSETSLGSEVVIAVNYDPGRAPLGQAAEWSHYIAIAAITFPLGGLPLFVAYLIAQMLPIFIPRVPKSLRWLFPVAMISAAILGPRPWIPLVALIAGSGSAASRRPPAWLAGLYGGPGWAGVAGAIGGFIALATGGSVWALALAALLGTLSALQSEDHEIRSPVEGPLSWAAMAMAVLLGLRTIEPALVFDPLSAAVFGVSWAVGIHVGWSRAPQADARATLSLPFVAAAALAGLTVVEGPGMVFLWGLVAVSVGGVLGMPADKGGPPSWPWIALLGFGASLAWVTALESLDLALWSAGSVALLGGFASLLHAGRIRTIAVDADVAPTTEAAPVLQLHKPINVTPPPVVIPPSIDQEDAELSAALSLLEALRQARKIRSDALEELKRAAHYSPVADAGSRARAVLTELVRDASRTKELLRSMS